MKKIVVWLTGKRRYGLLKKTKQGIMSLIMAAILVVTVFGLSACGPGDDEDAEVQDVILAISSKNTTSSIYGKEMVSWLKDCYADDEVTNFKTKANSNDITNMRRLNSGDVSLAVIPGDMAYYAMNGLEYFDKPMEKVSVIAELCSIGCQIITTRETGITSVSDLSGKKVAAGDKGSSSSLIFAMISEACGISKSVETVNLKYGESVEALENGEIDAIFVTGDAPLKRIMELAVTEGINLIGLSDETIGGLTEEYDFLVPVTIPAETYKNQTEDVLSVGVKLLLLKNDEAVPDEFGREMVSKIEEGLETIMENCPKASDFKKIQTE